MKYALVLLLVLVGPAMAATPHRVVNESLVDETTGLIWWVSYDPAVPGIWEVVTPLKQAAVLIDEEDDRAEITDDGALVVRDVCDGMPQLGFDLTGADTYTTLFVTTKACTHLLMACSTKDAVVTLDGGVTDHLHMLGGMQVTVDGLNIPAGATIRAKNQTAGQNYTNLYIAAW